MSADYCIKLSFSSRHFSAVVLSVLLVNTTELKQCAVKITIKKISLKT